MSTEEYRVVNGLVQTYMDFPELNPDLVRVWHGFRILIDEIINQKEDYVGTDIRMADDWSLEKLWEALEADPMDFLVTEYNQDLYHDYLLDKGFLKGASNG